MKVEKKVEQNTKTVTVSPNLQLGLQLALESTQSN